MSSCWKNNRGTNRVFMDIYYPVKVQASTGIFLFCFYIQDRFIGKEVCLSFVILNSISTKKSAVGHSSIDFWAMYVMSNSTRSRCHRASLPSRADSQISISMGPSKKSAVWYGTAYSGVTSDCPIVKCSKFSRERNIEIHTRRIFCSSNKLIALFFPFHGAGQVRNPWKSCVLPNTLSEGAQVLVGHRQRV